MIEFIRTLAGSLGFVKNNLDYTQTDWNEFIADPPPLAVILTSEFKPGFFNAGTRAKTNSPYDHTGIFVRKDIALMIRQIFPELLSKRSAKFSSYKPYDLGLISPQVDGHEILESSFKIEVNQFEKKYKRDDVALVMWYRDFSEEEITHILLKAYLAVGMPYSVSQIAKYVGLAANTTVGNFPVYVTLENGYIQTLSFMACSTYAAYSFHGKEEFFEPGNKYSNWELISPGGIDRYMKQASNWKRRLRNCLPGK